MVKSEDMDVSEKDDNRNNKAKELKLELLNLATEISIEDDNNNESENGVILGRIDEAIQALTALKELKLNKKNKRSLSSTLDQLHVPDEYRCPISKEIMKDPVVLSTGQVSFLISVFLYFFWVFIYLFWVFV